MYKSQTAPPPFEIAIPLERNEIEVLLDEKNTRFYSLWHEYRHASLSGPASIYLMEFESSLRKMFGKDKYPEIARQIQGRIPSLIYEIQEKQEPNAEEKKVFLIALYTKINHTAQERW